MQILPVILGHIGLLQKSAHAALLFRKDSSSKRAKA
jgi:hypothetical protein